MDPIIFEFPRALHAKREHRVVTVYPESAEDTRRARACAGMFRGRECR
jgi:hypothetical protein